MVIICLWAAFWITGPDCCTKSTLCLPCWNTENFSVRSVLVTLLWSSPASGFPLCLSPVGSGFPGSLKALNSASDSDPCSGLSPWLVFGQFLSFRWVCFVFSWSPSWSPHSCHPIQSSHLVHPVYLPFHLHCQHVHHSQFSSVSLCKCSLRTANA